MMPVAACHPAEGLRAIEGGGQQGAQLVLGQRPCLWSEPVVAPGRSANGSSAIRLRRAIQREKDFTSFA
jgi:hypothetical protein